jgi:serine kinase of HPr protein (carbohydrate metabolism regulator)
MSEKNIHASCVAIGNRGVLLLGPSGSGKSDIALQLIDAGAALVADDRTILSVRGGTLWAKAPAAIKGLIEIRGVGIVQLPSRASIKLALAVRLGREEERLPPPAFFRALDKSVPQITLDARFAGTPARIRAAVTAHSQGLFRDTFITK